MVIKELIKQTRKNLGETQNTFAKRFNTTPNTVSRWESGKYEVPNKVIEIVLSDQEIQVICSKCMGTGMVNRVNPTL